MVYGSETWTLSQSTTTILTTWERKIPRKIYGPLSDRGMWRIRTNEELNSLYQNIGTVTGVKLRRFRMAEPFNKN